MGWYGDVTDVLDIWSSAIGPGTKRNAIIHNPATNSV
jgi:hypothetical protein